MSEIESHDVNWVACWGVVELSGGIEKSLPVEEHWGVLSLVTDQIISYYNHTYTCGAKILLSTSIDDTIFLPVNWSSTNV